MEAEKEMRRGEGREDINTGKNRRRKRHKGEGRKKEKQ